VATLVERYGSPLFVTSEQRLRGNVRRLQQAFSSRGVKAIHGWSYKTNYNGAVCNVLHQEGSWAEVVSRFEYEKARRLGVPGERILFNGPNKPRAILERAIAEGAHLHVDHLDELTTIEDIARRRGKPVPVALRVNFDTGFTEPWSRFGFNLESGQAREAIATVQSSPHLELVGLHSHIGTFILDPRAYAAQVRILCGLMKDVEADGRTRLEYLDIGGGFPSRNALQGIYLPPEQVVPDREEFAEATNGLRWSSRAAGPWWTMPRCSSPRWSGASNFRTAVRRSSSMRASTCSSRPSGTTTTSAWPPRRAESRGRRCSTGRCA
jgi:diaminopimelate decarboxylase